MPKHEYGFLDQSPRLRIAMKALVCVVVGTLCLAGCLGPCAFYFLLHEDLWMGRYSFAYFVTIDSDVVRSVPVIDPIGEAQFYYRCGDGPKPPANAIYYTSSASLETLTAPIHEMILQQGYVFYSHVHESPRGAYTTYFGERSEVFLKFSPEGDDHIRVQVEEPYEQPYDPADDPPGPPPILLTHLRGKSKQDIIDRFGAPNRTDETVPNYDGIRTLMMEALPPEITENRNLRIQECSFGSHPEEKLIWFHEVDGQWVLLEGVFYHWDTNFHRAVVPMSRYRNLSSTTGPCAW